MELGGRGCGNMETGALGPGSVPNWWDYISESSMHFIGTFFSLYPRNILGLGVNLPRVRVPQPQRILFACNK